MLNSHSIQKQNALTGFFGINQQWLKTCTKFMEKMKKAMLLKHGLFSVKIDLSNWKQFNTKNTYCTKKLKNFFKKEKITMSFTYESNLIQ